MAERILYCNFCGKNNQEVCRLIAGPDVYICDECTKLCMEIVLTAEDQESAGYAEYESWKTATTMPPSVN